MSSIAEQIVEAIETAMADPSILFLYGKKREKQNRQKRCVLLVRESGVASMTTAPKGVTVDTVGPTTTKTRVKFQRSEKFRCVLSAESEETLDQLIDNFLVTVWELYAPNAFEDETPYEWGNLDAEGGGATLARQPSVTILLTFRFMTTGGAKLNTIIEETNLSPQPE